MDQLAAVYPELSKTAGPPVKPDGSIQRKVKELDFDGLIDEVPCYL